MLFFVGSDTHGVFVVVQCKGKHAGHRLENCTSCVTNRHECCNISTVSGNLKRLLGVCTHELTVPVLIHGYSFKIFIYIYHYTVTNAVSFIRASLVINNNYSLWSQF